MAKRILFVDNDSDLRKAYCQSLREKGFEVVEAIDGKSALNYLISRSPDLVVSEVMLPVLNGFDLLQKIRQRPNTAKLPVILITHLKDESKMAEKLGANEYLVKSATSPGQLISKINSLKN